MIKHTQQKKSMMNYNDLVEIRHGLFVRFLF